MGSGGNGAPSLRVNDEEPESTLRILNSKNPNIWGRMHSEPERPLTEYRSELECPATSTVNYRSCPEIGTAVKFREPGADEKPHKIGRGPLLTMLSSGVGSTAGPTVSSSMIGRSINRHQQLESQETAGSANLYQQQQQYFHQLQQTQVGNSQVTGGSSSASTSSQAHQASHLWPSHARTTLSSIRDHSFLTRAISRSRESVSRAGIPDSHPVSQSLGSSCDNQPLLGRVPLTSLTSGDQGTLASGHERGSGRSSGRMLENELERIAADSLRINGVAALRSFRHLRKTPQMPTDSASGTTPGLSLTHSGMKTTSADSADATREGLISVQSEHPKPQRSFASNSIDSEKRKSNSGGGGGPAGFHRPNVGK